MLESGQGAATITKWGHHPAVRAWAALHGADPAPRGIDVLAETSKTGAYRLHGLGPGRERVVAKRARPRELEVERLVYQEVLTHLPIRSLHCHGFVEADSSAWLFLEDADQGAVLPAWKYEHWPLVARWLGELHGAAAGASTGARLPHRGAGHYLHHLRAARSLIGRHADHPAFHDGDRAMARRLLSQLDAIEGGWASVERACRESPSTLVHGDLVPKNLRLHVEDGKVAILLFDWETAGWGVPAADLARLAEQPDDATTHAYVTSVGATWPQMDPARVQLLARIGHVFRLLASVRWAAQGLDHAWIERSRWKLTKYEPDLRGAVAALRSVS
jgi:hypothetical protein